MVDTTNEEIIPLTVDFMFTSIFNKKENIDIVESFISAYFGIPLREVRGHVELMNRSLEQDSSKQARRTVDLLLDYRGNKINIELSNKMSSGVLERNIVYLSSIHSKQLLKGDHNYSKINYTVQINLNNLRCNKQEIRETYYLRNEAGEILSEKIRIDMVDLVKGSEKCYTLVNNKLARWCKVLTSRNEKELKEALGGDLMSDEEYVKLYDEVRKLSDQGDYIELYTELSKEEMEQNTYIEEAKEAGIEQGLEQGLELGRKQSNIEIAQKMLDSGMDIDTIIKITGVSKEEIL